MSLVFARGSRLLPLCALLAVLAASCDRTAATTVQGPPPFRVCADPNNLPFSNDRLEGFENHLAALVAADLGTTVEYAWWAQRRGFLRRTLDAGLCDVVMGIPSIVESVTATRPYYRSSYVYVTRRTAGLRFDSLDDPLLRRLSIAVPLVGEDGGNAPPAHALSRRGMVRNVVGYSVYGDYSTPNPPARIIDAVANGDVDVALAWGPLAGFFAARQDVALDVVPIHAAGDEPFSLAFDISLGVRRGDAVLARRLDEALERRREEVDAILAEFHVPHIDEGSEERR